MSDLAHQRLREEDGFPEEPKLPINSGLMSAHQEGLFSLSILSESCTAVHAVVDYSICQLRHELSFLKWRARAALSHGCQQYI